MAFFPGQGHRLSDYNIPPMPIREEFNEVKAKEELFNPLRGTWVSSLYKEEILNGTLGKYFYSKMIVSLTDLTVGCVFC